VEIAEKKGGAFNGLQTYDVNLTGNAQQYTFSDEVIVRR